jgi:hypothetical protein
MNNEEENKVEKMLNEFKQLDKMSAEDRTEIIKGYHDMITDKLESVLHTLDDVQRLSPITIPITKTAVIIAETDFLGDGKLRVAGIVGHRDYVQKLVEGLWEQIPQVFEAVCKAKGYARGN